MCTCLFTTQHMIFGVPPSIILKSSLRIMKSKKKKTLKQQENFVFRLVERFLCLLV